MAGQFLLVYWPVLFAFSTVLLVLFLDPSPAKMWPPTLELSGRQAASTLSSPWFLGIVLPLAAGVVWIHGFARRAKLSAQEHGSLVWWWANALWFHTGCDIFSGYLQRMPVLTQLYIRMNSRHLAPRWDESRAFLDAGYMLELLVEVPLALWVCWLFVRRHRARHVVEVFAAAVQMAGTVCYYAPGLMTGEVTTWLSWMDRCCGSVWVIFPFLLLRRHFDAACRAPNGKAA